MVDKNLDALIEDVVHGALEDYVEKMSSRLTQYLLDGVDNPDMLSTLAARAKSDAMAIFVKYKGRISKETREAFLEAVEGYETEVEQTLEKLHTKRQLTKQGALEFAQAARGIGEIVNRQNIALANTMATTWYTIAANAVVRKELGDSRRAIMEDAVRTLSDAGIETIDYKSGVKTTIDAAVRRHIVSQVSQAKAQILSDRCDQYDQDLVFVSAHFGARPSHAIWQGKVYSRSGTSDKYPSLDEGTGYSGTGPFGSLGDRLCGVNCQHEMVPYMPGLSQLPDLSFEKEQKRYGMTSEEYYRATQKQRALERKVRKYKRRIALGQEQGLDMVDDRYKLGRTQALLREHCRANGLTRLYERERAYGVKRQPRGLGRIDFKNEMAMAKRATTQSARDARSADIDSNSDFMKCRSFKELQGAAEEKYGFYLDDALGKHLFSYTQRLCAGIDDTLMKFPQLKKAIGNVSIDTMTPRTSAATDTWGTIFINSKMNAHASSTPCSDGRHEAGHLIEVLLSKYDEKEFQSAKHAKKIITRALQNYNKANPENTRSAESLIYNSISTYPSQLASEYSKKNATKIFYREALAECVRVATEIEHIDKDSFLSFVIESVLKEIG